MYEHKRTLRDNNFEIVNSLKKKSRFHSTYPNNAKKVVAKIIKPIIEILNTIESLYFQNFNLFFSLISSTITLHAFIDHIDVIKVTDLSV